MLKMKRCKNETCSAETRNKTGCSTQPAADCPKHRLWSVNGGFIIKMLPPHWALQEYLCSSSQPRSASIARSLLPSRPALEPQLRSQETFPAEASSCLVTLLSEWQKPQRLTAPHFSPQLSLGPCTSVNSDTAERGHAWSSLYWQQDTELPPSSAYRSALSKDAEI